MTKLTLKDFTKKDFLKENTMTGSDFERVCSYPIHPEDLIYHQREDL